MKCLKSYMSWAIGYSMASLLSWLLLHDQHHIHPVSLLAKKFYDISNDHEVFLNLPAQLDGSNMHPVANMQLKETSKGVPRGGEQRRSSDMFLDLQQNLCFYSEKSFEHT